MSSSSADRTDLRSAAVPVGEPAAGKPDIAHVGYHRTGTNFLQEEVFPRLGPQIFRPSQSGQQFFADAEAFDEAAARKFYLGEQERNGAGVPFLISHERLTGTAERDDLSVPGKLHRLNPEMKIIVVVRSQFGMLRSLYHLHVKRGGTERYADYVRRLVSARRCDYWVMVSRFVDCFGRERVLTLLYEDLASSPQDFLDELCAFIGAAPLPASDRVVNARSSDSALLVKRFMNEKLDAAGTPAAWKDSLMRAGQALALKVDRLSRDLRGGPLGEIDVGSERQAIHDAYAEGNGRLAALIGRPLGDRGYPI